MVKNLKDIFTMTLADKRENWEGLEFGDLVEGDKYISLPIPGDGNKQGSGFKNTYSLLQKIQSVRQDDFTYNSVEVREGKVIDVKYNSIELKVGRLVNTPLHMPVIKVE